MTDGTVDYELRDEVAVLRINDPANLNALSIPMRHQLRDALRRGGDEARAILLTGAGRAFCSGANLSQGAVDLANPHRDAGAFLEAITNQTILAMKESPVPIVVAVRGAAAGAGCSLALCGDVIVCSENAYFLQAFRHIGLVPDGGSAYLLAKAIGRIRAMQVMLLGDRLPANTALEWGLVTQVVPDGELDNHALKIAKDLARGPYALGLIRQLAWSALDSNLAEQLDRERWEQRRAGRSQDFLEGMAAFAEKRPASFEGK